VREQVVTPRANGRSVLTNRGRSGGLVQKPVRRNANSERGRLRAILSYLPLAGKVLLAIITGILVFASYRAAASASFFETRRVDVSGTSRTSSDQVSAVVRHATASTGVWRADLQAISVEIEKLPWVRRAVVSRILPDGLRVRITERVPLAVVRTAAGKFVWVDEDAVTLSQMLPADQMPAFFIRGWDESGTTEARTENRERVGKYLEMSRDWAALGLTERVSEVNLGDPHDIRALLAGNDAQIEVRLGERNLGTRLQKALKVLDEQRSTRLGPFITYVVASQDGKIIFGYSAGAPAATDGEASPPASNEAKDQTRSEPRASTRTAEKRTPKVTPSVPEKKETRPRRVG